MDFSSHSILTYVYRMLIAIVFLTIIRSIARDKELQQIDQFSYFTGKKINPSNFERQLNMALQRAAKSPKSILFWRKKSEKNKEKTLEPKCGSCRITYNKSKITDQSTAAVVFLYTDVRPKYMPPKSSRRADQLYVWMSMEAPPYLVISRKNTFQFEDSIKFNATMHYRRDSDIYVPYGPPKKFGEESNLTKVIQMKTKVGVALVSNCGITLGAGVRKPMLKRIAEKFPLELYGNCFRPFHIQRGARKKITDFFKPYKFYFAFENSYHCRDYITEKLYKNALDASTVPVVWGASKEDYEAVLPQNGFVYVEDFSDLDELVKYLKFLDDNDEAYLGHLKMIADSIQKTNALNERVIGACQLCRIVNGINVDDVYRPNSSSSPPSRPFFTPTVADRTVKSLKSWIHKDNADCFNKHLKLTESGAVLTSAKSDSKKQP